MKRIILPLAFVVTLLVGCSDGPDTKTSDHGDGTHQHEDGTVHSHDTITPSGQQEFSDTTHKHADPSHEHGHDHPHPHEDGKDHQH